MCNKIFTTIEGNSTIITTKEKKILEAANLMIIKSIVECIENVLSGNIHLEKDNFDKLKRHRAILRKISKKGNRLKQKKKIIVQHGGAFLPALLAPIIAVIADRLIPR